MAKTGHRLIAQVIENTGLPFELVENELNLLFKKSGISPTKLTVDELRVIMADYLQDVLLSAKEEFTG